MTSRADIISGRLIYTCNCGFIDTGHANPGGAKKLMEDILHERHVVDHRLNNNHTIEGNPAFVIGYYQGMGNKVLQVVDGGQFLIRKGLSVQRKREVALAIFMRVSLGFEAMQSNWFWSNVTDSGFSAEDLMSNLIGFYRALLGLSMAGVRQQCGEVSQAAALAVYDQNLQGGIGQVKVQRFLEPRCFPCDECKGTPQVPGVFRSLRPADLTGDYIPLPTSLPFKHWGLGQPIDFDRTGRPR